MMMMSESQYFYCKCSVCFENDSEMELINCGDQYCILCLERYVEYRIKEGSWGILPVELTCPVCSQRMIDEDWIPYVSPRVLEVWKRFQQKRKNNLKHQQISRTCPTCHHVQPIMGDKSSSISVNSTQFSDLGILLMDCLDSMCGTSWRTVFDLEQALDLSSELTADLIYEDLEEVFDNANILFDDFLKLLVKLQIQGVLTRGNEKLIQLFLNFGRKFLLLIHKMVFEEETDYYEDVQEGEEEEEEEDDELLISLQLSHITMQLNFQFSFPFGICDSCGGKFCLPCERVGWHHRKNHTHQRSLVGSKQCPRCFVLIEKESDGCNEMQCNYCGMKFCWECGKKWSKECGVYKCSHGNGKNQQNHHLTTPEKEKIVNSNSNSSSEDDDEVESIYSDPLDFVLQQQQQQQQQHRQRERDPEIGIPNVSQIANRRKIFFQKYE